MAATKELDIMKQRYCVFYSLIALEYKSDAVSAFCEAARATEYSAQSLAV